MDGAMSLIFQVESIRIRLRSLSYASHMETLENLRRTSELEDLFQELLSLVFSPIPKFYNVLLKAFLRKGQLGLALRSPKKRELTKTNRPAIAP